MSTGLQSGEIVGGYRIESLLGRGGMAAVYLAEDTRLKRKVALKVLSPELAEDETFRRRFVDESERLASVDHPNIIPVYEAGQDGDHLFIAMRLVETTDLKQLVDRGGPLAPERAVALVTQVAGALDAAHAKGMVHRDVKPANVLVAMGSGGDHAYLSDFGLTKRTEETSGLTKTGYFMGTIDYIAPEQISGKGVDGRTDQYALACVLFQCLTGHPPYPRDDDAAVLFSHLSEPVPKVTETRHELPTAIDDVIAKGMAKEKDERYPDCLGLARAAREALLGDGASRTPKPEPTRIAAAPLAPTAIAAPVTEAPVVPAAPATEPSAGEPEPPGGGRRRVAVGIGAGVLVLVLIIGGIALLSGGDSGGGGGGGGSGTGGEITVVSLDPSNGSTLNTLRDGAFSEHLWGVLSIEDGDLWQATPDSLVRRDAESGDILQTLPIKRQWIAIDGGFGYAWIAHPFAPGETEVERMNPDTGASKTIRVDGDPVDLKTGNGAVWLLTRDGTLTEISRESMKIVNTFDTGVENPGSAVPMAGFIWICACESGHVAQFDPRKNEVVSELELPDQGFVIGVDTNFAEGERVWILDPVRNTLTPVDPATSEAGAPIGVGGARITDAAIIDNVLWVSSQTELTEVELASADLDQHVFDVPEGISAGSVAPAPDGSRVWVGNCGCPIEQ